MTVGIIQLHADAILALLASAPPAPPFEPLTIYDGALPKNEPVADLYALVYLSMSTPEGSGLNGVSDRALMTATVHSVGSTAGTARIVAQRVRGALLDVVPTVPGRTCYQIRHADGGGPPQRDETTGVLVMDQVDVYELETVPATA